MVLNVESAKKNQQFSQWSKLLRKNCAQNIQTKVFMFIFSDQTIRFAYELLITQKLQCSHRLRSDQLTKRINLQIFND